MSFREDALKLVVDNEYKKIVEVGVWKGELSRMLYKVADKLVLVDPWSVKWNSFFWPVINDGEIYACTMGEKLKTQEELDIMFGETQNSMPSAIVLREASLTASTKCTDGYFDFVFIDAIHTYEHCKEDILAWMPKIRPGGMIAGDDYIPEHDTVSKAVNELLPKANKTRTWNYKL